MATWKKLIVSGSDAHLASVTASNSLSVGTNQIITTTQAGTKLTGSFTGSFVGDGSGLSGVTATPTFPTTAKTDLTSTDKFFVNDDAGNGTIGNKQITYANLLTDLAGTNLAVESTDSLTLASSITGITSFQATSISGSSITGSFTGSFRGDGSGLTGVASKLAVTASAVESSIDLKTQGLTINGTANEVTTTISGQTVTIGLPDSVTITQDLTVGGNLVVTGDVTQIQVTNLNVEDQFTLLASGSGTTDAGIIVASGSINAGSAIYHDITDHRWAVAKGVSSTATSVTPLEYITTVSMSAADPSTVNYGVGEMHVNTNTGDVWIYS